MMAFSMGWGTEEEAIFLEAARPAFGSDPPSLRGGRWPSREAKASEQGLASAALDAVEEGSRRWAATQVVYLLHEADLPVIKELGVAFDPDSGLMFFLGGLRAATIKARLSARKAFRAGVVRILRHCWPGSQVEVFDYLVMIAEVPCGRAGTQDLLSARAFLGNLWRDSVPDRRSPHPLVMGAVRMLTATLEARSWKPTRRAPPLPLGPLAAFESRIADEGFSLYVRFHAEFNCLEFWDFLRFDDFKWAELARLYLLEPDLEITLRRTIASGPVRKISVLRSSSSSASWLVERRWLSTWVEVLGAMGPVAGCLLALPAEDPQGFGDRVAGYAVASACAAALLRSLRAQSEGGSVSGDYLEVMKDSAVTLLVDVAAGY